MAVVSSHLEDVRAAQGDRNRNQRPLSTFVSKFRRHLLPRLSQMMVRNRSHWRGSARVELLPPGHHVRVSENMTARNPIFCVVLKDGEHSQVEAEWPDGTIEQATNSKLASKL